MSPLAEQPTQTPIMSSLDAKKPLERICREGSRLERMEWVFTALQVSTCVLSSILGAGCLTMSLIGFVTGVRLKRVDVSLLSLGVNLGGVFLIISSVRHCVQQMRELKTIRAIHSLIKKIRTDYSERKVDRLDLLKLQSIVNLDLINQNLRQKST